MINFLTWFNKKEPIVDAHDLEFLKQSNEALRIEMAKQKEKNKNNQKRIRGLKKLIAKLRSS